MKIISLQAVQAAEERQSEWACLFQPWDAGNGRQGSDTGGKMV